MCHRNHPGVCSLRLGQLWQDQCRPNLQLSILQHYRLRSSVFASRRPKRVSSEISSPSRSNETVSQYLQKYVDVHLSVFGCCSCVCAALRRRRIEDQSNICRHRCIQCTLPSSGHLRSPSTSQRIWKQDQRVDAAEPCRRPQMSLLETQRNPLQPRRSNSARYVRFDASVSASCVHASHKLPVLRLPQQHRARHGCRMNALKAFQGEVALEEPHPRCHRQPLSKWATCHFRCCMMSSIGRWSCCGL